MGLKKYIGSHQHIDASEVVELSKTPPRDVNQEEIQGLAHSSLCFPWGLAQDQACSGCSINDS